MITKALHRFERFSPPRVGVVLVMLVLVVGVALFQKTRIMTAFEPGADELQVTFARDYQLRSYVTKVKVAGVPVGIVTDVDHEEDGSAVATLQLDPGVQDRLREQPSAAIRPSTLLGGNYYVELYPGGDPGTAEAIPVGRTEVPVELDRVLEVLRPEARRSTQQTIARLDALLDERGSRSVREVVAEAPGTLEPLTPVLQGLRGQRPNQDLEVLVSSLETLGRELAADQPQLHGILVDLADVSSAIGDSSPQVAAAVDDLPENLDTTRAGLAALEHTLQALRDVSDDAMPTARELSTTLTALEPALERLEPVLVELRPALADLRPLVDDLVPSAQDGIRALGDVDGPPIDRLKGPIVTAVNSDWHGTGDYAKGGNDTVFYKEFADFVAGMNNSGKMTDRNGSTIHFQPGFGVGSLSGTPISFEQLVMQLAYPEGAP